MTIEELYEKLGGSFVKVCGRLPGRRFVERFLTKYLADDSAEHLLAAVKAGNLTESYRYAMALKGVAGDLGLEDLEEAVGALALSVRDGRMPADVKALADQVECCHLAAVKAIQLYLAEK